MTETPSRHPVVVAHEAHRAADLQLRVADAITSFAGSMRFVYLHALLFAGWMAFVESDPWPKLTLVVSLEAIFLSTFVMIGQNRQASFQQARPTTTSSRRSRSSRPTRSSPAPCTSSRRRSTTPSCQARRATCSATPTPPATAASER